MAEAMPKDRNIYRHLTIALLTGLYCLASGGCKDTTIRESWQGYIEADYRYVGSPVAGFIEVMPVRRGQVVTQGDALYTLDGVNERRELEQAVASLASAEAQLADARKGEREPALRALEASAEALRADLERFRLERERQAEMIRTGASSAQAFEEASFGQERLEAQLQAALARLQEAQLGAREDAIRALEANVEAVRAQTELAKWRLEQTQVKSPVTGVVEDVLYRPGEWVAAGRPVIVIFPPEDMLAYFFISDSELSQVRPGEAVTLIADGISEPLSATIRAISSEPEFTPPVIFSNDTRGRLLYRIEAGLDPAAAKALHPGQPVRVEGRMKRQD